ncbi:MAG: NAD(P)H-dependent oxidoreductase subunit E [Desulfosarcina sp.]|nr:NAD(P)H-dependent oxidoreductase subunit E [Desulfosarcina sp.]MBC2744137.1 NAD(P)H-dependent oxidoreductase subunit E [Desulfosarcina sp.]MBC2767046.1 NAD(P)H-dependent oxidoreductase subunit E [Desulfosarcina sp.]
MDVAGVNEILEKFQGVKGNLIGILHEVQNRYSYLPEEELRYISKRTQIPITQIYSIVNFYNRFSLEPKGKNVISVCLGTACHVKGAGKVMDALREKLNIDIGESTDDMNFSLEEVRCIGACSLAPAVVVNEETYGQVKPKQVSTILKQHESSENG